LSGDSGRIERLVNMSERLIEAIEADIVALKTGKPVAMRTIEPEMQRLSALYGREAQGITPEAVEESPAALRDRFVETTKKFRELLVLHARLIARVRHASEGMIRAIAEEVQRQAEPLRTYAPLPSGYARPTPAMVYSAMV
jgi:hypothetical protein